MGWIETLSKEAFQLAVREAVKPELNELEKRLDGRMGSLDGRMSNLEGRMCNIEARMDKFDGRLDRLEGRVGDLAERVSRLEGTIEGTLRAYEANIRSMFVEFQRNIEREIFTRLIDEKRNKSAA
jgi:predicted nuclease with TOPRIM domain